MYVGSIKHNIHKIFRIRELENSKFDHKNCDLAMFKKNLEHFLKLMPSPSAFSKFVLSVLKFLGILKFLSYTQNILGVLK